MVLFESLSESYNVREVPELETREREREREILLHVRLYIQLCQGTHAT